MSLLINPEPFTADVDRFFNRLFDAPTGSRNWVPPIDLIEADDHFVLRADLPGLSEEDISLEVQDGTLTLNGERRADDLGENGWTRLERAYGRFSRSLSLPEGIDPDGVSAAFDRGVLTVTVPKPEARKPRRIAIGRANGRPADLEGNVSEQT